MTADELRAKFKTAYKIIQRERTMREHVFRHDPVARAQKVAEMDRLLEIVTELKDALKEHVGASLTQLPLIDVPATRTEFK